MNKKYFGERENEQENVFEKIKLPLLKTQTHTHTYLTNININIHITYTTHTHLLFQPKILDQIRHKKNFTRSKEKKRL